MSLENLSHEPESGEANPEEAEKARLEQVQSLLTRAIERLEDNNDYGLPTLSPEDFSGYDVEMLEKSLNFLENNGGPVPTKQEILTYGQSRDNISKLMDTMSPNQEGYDLMMRRANVRSRLVDFISNKLGVLYIRK